MKLVYAILLTVFLLTVAMFAFWASVMKRSAGILEYDHPSRNIKHAIDKGVFIDSLEIVAADTAEFDGHVAFIRVFPTTSWIEKATYWKSGTMDTDSIGFYSDTVYLVVQFNTFVDGKNWRPDSEYSIGEFMNDRGATTYITAGEYGAQLQLKMAMQQVSDTMAFTNPNNERFVVRRRN